MFYYKERIVSKYLKVFNLCLHTLMAFSYPSVTHPHDVNMGMSHSR